MPKGTLLKILLNSILGIVLIFVWSRFVNLSELLKIIKTVNLNIIFLFAVLTFLSTAIKVLRFKFLLKNHHLPYKDLLMLNFLSQFLSFLIPIRAGEVTKGVYLSTQYNFSFAQSLVWVFIDRFLDFWMTLIIIGVFIFIVPNNIPLKVEQIVFILLVFLTFFFILAIVSEKLFKNIINLLSKLLVLESLRKLFKKFAFNIVEGFSILRRSPKELIYLMFLTTLAIVVDSLVWLSIFKSFNVNIGFTKAILGDTLSALTFVIPAAPGYVGSAEAAILAVFGGILGIEANLTSAAIIVFHILTLIAIITFGLISLYFLKFDLKLVWAKIRKQN